jgi:hypothetical protein
MHHQQKLCSACRSDIGDIFAGTLAEPVRLSQDIAMECSHIHHTVGPDVFEPQVDLYRISNYTPYILSSVITFTGPLIFNLKYYTGQNR